MTCQEEKIWLMFMKNVEIPRHVNLQGISLLTNYLWDNEKCNTKQDPILKWQITLIITNIPELFRVFSIGMIFS